MEQQTLELQVKEIPVEQKISLGLQSFEIKKTELQSLAAKADGLQITRIDDKETIKQVSEIRKELKAERVAIEKQGKALRDNLTIISKSITAKENELVAIIEPIEKSLLAQEKWVESEKQRIEDERIKAEQSRIQGRIKILMDSGCVTDGINYTIGNLGIDDIAVKGMPDETFTKFANDCKAENERQVAAKVETERLAKEAADKAEAERLAEIERQRVIAENNRIESERLDNLRKEQEAKQAEIERKEAEIKDIQDKQESEEKRVKAEKENALWRSRLSELQKIGWNGQDAFSKLGASETPVFTYEELITLSDSDFNERRDSHNNATERAIKEIEAKEEAARQAKIIEDKRIADEMEAKRLADIEAAKEQARKDEAERIRLENIRLQQEKEAQEAETKRIAGLAPDKEKLTAFATKIASIVDFTVSDPAAQLIVDEIAVMIGKMQKHILTKVKAL